MKKCVIAIALVLLFSSCSKEEPTTTPKDQDIPLSEFQALKKEVEELKSTIASLTTGDQEKGVSKSEFDEMKKENETLKAQVELLTSGFFEVDGLRFDKNGTLISVPKLESQATEKIGNNTLTTTRK